MTIDAVPGVAEAGAAAVPEAPAPNIVRLPNGHTVTLQPAVTIPLGMAAVAVMQSSNDPVALEYGLARLWISCDAFGEPYAIRAWDFTRTAKNGDEEPEPITPESIARLLPFEDGGSEVAEAAAGLYAEAVMRPLLRRRSQSLSNGQTGNGTLPPLAHGSKHPRRSKRSSPRNTAGKR